MRDHWRLWLLAAVIITAPFTVASASATSAGVTDGGTQSIGATVTTDPGGTIAAQRWETLTVTVRANATAVTGYQTTVTYDPSVLQVKNISGTEAFDAPVAAVDNRNGTVVFNQIRSGETADPALAELTVQVIGTDGQRSALSVVAGETKFSNATGVTSTPDSSSGLTVAVQGDGGGTDGPGPADQSGLGIGGPAALLIAVAVAIVGWIAVRSRRRTT
jgi:hypothetical protein